MVKQELISRSPLRILEQSMHGGVGKGNIGVIAARQGVGKTACLVHIATDQLFQGKHVIHVSFASHANHIISWYEDIFDEIAARTQLDSAREIHDEIVRNRIIMHFRQGEASVAHITESIVQLTKQACFSADTVVVDGYDFNSASPGELEQFRRCAAEFGLEFWFSATISEQPTIVDNNGVPRLLSSFNPHISVLIVLEPHGDHVHLHLVKDHDQFAPPDTPLKLDPHILLIAEQVS